MRTGYQYRHLSDEAKKVASEEMEGTLLTQRLYNIDGTQFEHSTTIFAYEGRYNSFE